MPDSAQIGYALSSEEHGRGHLPDDPDPSGDHRASRSDGGCHVRGRFFLGVGLSPADEVIETFKSEGGKGKPLYGQVEVCWASAEKSGRRTAHEWWPTTALGGELSQELKLPAHFEQAAQSVREEDLAEKVVCGPDPGKHIEAIRKYIDAGYDHVYLHQIDPDQEGVLRVLRPGGPAEVVNAKPAG